MSTTTDSFSGKQLSYKFPDPTDPANFQNNESSSSSSIYSKLQQSIPSNSNYQPNQSPTSTSTHPFTYSNQSQSIHHPSETRPSPPTPSAPASLIISDHPLETDWSILSLKNHALRDQGPPILSGQSFQIPPILPITSHHETPNIPPIIHSSDPSPFPPLNSNPCDQFHCDHTSKCQRWLENLTNTSEFSYQVSENLAPSSPDHSHASCHQKSESPLSDSASLPINQNLNHSSTQPENNEPKAKSSAGLGGPLFECLLDPSMDLSSSYLEPHQLAESISPHSQLLNPSLPPLEPSSLIHSQVSPSANPNCISSHLRPQVKSNPDADPLSNAAYASLSSSPSIPFGSKDTHRFFRFNCWTLLFNLFWPTSLAFFIFSQYSKQQAQQKTDTLLDSIEQDGVKIDTDSIDVTPCRILEKEISADLMQVIESSSTLNHQKIVPKLDAVLEDSPITRKQEEDQDLISDHPISSSQASKYRPNSELDHQALHLKDRTSSEDTDPQRKLPAGKDLDQTPQVDDSSETCLGRDSDSKCTHYNHDQDSISMHPRDADADLKVVEALVPMTNQPVLATPQLEATQPPSSFSVLTTIFLIFGLTVVKLFLFGRKSKDSRIEVTAEEMISKLDSSMASNSKNLLTNLDTLRQVSINQIELTKLIKTLENRIRISKNVPRIELGLLAWSKHQTGDQDGSEKLWRRFWSDEDESMHLDAHAELENDSGDLLKLLIEYSRHSLTPILSSRVEEQIVSVAESKPFQMMNVKLDEVKTPQVVNQKTKGSRSLSTTRKKSMTADSNENIKRKKAAPLVKEEELEVENEREIHPKLSRRRVKKEEDEDRLDGDLSDRTILPENPPLSKKKTAVRSSKRTPPELVEPTPHPDSTKIQRKKPSRKSEPQPLPSSSSSLASGFVDLLPPDSGQSRTSRRSSTRLKKT